MADLDGFVAAYTELRRLVKLPQEAIRTELGGDENEIVRTLGMLETMSRLVREKLRAPTAETTVVSAARMGPIDIEALPETQLGRPPTDEDNQTKPE